MLPESVVVPLLMVKVPVPLSALLKVVVALPLKVKLLPVFMATALLKVMLLEPLIVAEALSPITTLLLFKVKSTKDCKVPPFKLRTPVLNGLVALLATKVPLMRVVLPL